LKPGKRNKIAFTESELFLFMTLIVTPKTKGQEKILKEFLETHSINFQSEAEEDAALLNAM
jgi:hypothetical protein